MNLLEALATTAWAEYHFGSVCSSQHLRRSTIMRAVQRGWMEAIGMVAICDADGFLLQPERYREGFVLTAEGKRVLRRRDPQTASMFLPRAPTKLTTPMPPVTPRRPLDDSEPDGYLESTRDWIRNNEPAVEWFLENAAALQEILWEREDPS